MDVRVMDGLVMKNMAIYNALLERDIDTSCMVYDNNNVPAC